MDAGSLDRWRGRELRLAELVDASRELLEAMRLGAGDRRVTSYPDARTLRFYQTSGLIAPPLRYAGRQAIYGFDHLLRALSVKLFQAEGLSLAQVQQALSSAESAQLEAAVREALVQAGPRPEATAGLAAGVGGWTAQPETDARALLAIELAPGVSVLIDPARVADPSAVLRALERAMAPETGRGGQA